MTEKIISVLFEMGWFVDCESPLELSHKNGDKATGQAADALLFSILAQYDVNNDIQPVVNEEIIKTLIDYRAINKALVKKWESLDFLKGLNGDISEEMLELYSSTYSTEIPKDNYLKTDGSVEVLDIPQIIKDGEVYKVDGDFTFKIKTPTLYRRNYEPYRTIEFYFSPECPAEGLSEELIESYGEKLKQGFIKFLGNDTI